MIFKWVFQELRNQKSFLAFFVLNICLGFFSFLSLQILKDSISTHYQQKALEGLGGDFAISVRRKWTASELDFIHSYENSLRSSHSYEFFAMTQVLSSENTATAKLVMVKSIDANFPLYGQLSMLNSVTPKEENQQKNQISSELDLKPTSEGQTYFAWGDKGFAEAFGLQIDEKFQTGDLQLQLKNTVLDDATQSFRFSGMASKIYISEAALKVSKLLSFGSTFSDIYYFRFLDTVDVPLRQKIILDFKTKLSDPSIQITTAEESAQERANALKYVTDFFSMISLVSAFLSIVVGYFLVRSYLQRSYLTMAIYNSLGLSRRKIFQIYLLQVVILVAIGFLITLGLSILSLPLMNAALNQKLGVVLVKTSVGSAVILLAGLAILTIVIVIFPFFENLKKLSIQQVFKENYEEANTFLTDNFFNINRQSIFKEIFKNINFKMMLQNIRQIFYYTMILVTLVSISIWQTHSLKMGLTFSGGLLAACIILVVVGGLVLRGLEKLSASCRWIYRFSILGLSRKRTLSLISFVCIAAGVLVLQLIQSIQLSLSTEIETPKGLVLPQYFAFDIQDDQALMLQKLVQDQGGIINYMSPMVRARILKVNEVPFERISENGSFQTRESESEARFRNRGVNLSYRDQLSNSEQIIAGQFWNPSELKQSNDPSMPAQLSVEESYAKRLGLKLNDQLEFDIQGLSVMGKITSLRKVRWNSFQPNFFILFQPGVLEAAPKTFVTSISHMDKAKTSNFYSTVLKQAPNISVIDVGELTRKILELSQQFLLSLKVFALGIVLGGILIVSIIMATYFQAQQKEYMLMKVLGAVKADLQKYIWLQMTILIILSGFLGLLLGEIFSYFVSGYLFDGVYYFHLFSGLWILAILAMIATVMSLTLNYFLRRRPISSF